MSGLGNSYQVLNGSSNSYYGNQESCYRKPYKNKIIQRKIKKMQESVEKAFPKEEQCKKEEKQRIEKG